MDKDLITNVANIIGDRAAQDLRTILWDNFENYPHIPLSQVLDEWRNEKDIGLWYEMSENYSVANILRAATGSGEEEKFADEMVAIQELLIDNISADWQITENADGDRELKEVFTCFTEVK